MPKLISLALGSLFAASLLFSNAVIGATAAPASDCAIKAVSKDGKPLSGAAKASFIKKCEADTVTASGCAGKAVSKDDKPLSGAARASFIKKCEADTMTASGCDAKAVDKNGKALGGAEELVREKVCS